MALIYLLYIAVVFYWQTKAVKSSKNTKRKAIGLYAVYAIAPVIVYGVVFITLVGIEELAETAIISEGISRTLFFVIVGGMGVVIVTTLLFSFVVLSIKINGISAK